MEVDADDLQVFLDNIGKIEYRTLIISVKRTASLSKAKLSVEIDTFKAGTPFYLDTKSAIEGVADSLDGWSARDFEYALDGPDLCAQFSKRKCRKPNANSF